MQEVCGTRILRRSAFHGRPGRANSAIAFVIADGDITRGDPESILGSYRHRIRAVQQDA